MCINTLIRSLLLALGMLAVSGASFAQVRVGVAISIAPPDLPVYDQPVCPGDGYIWTPGYWAYGDDGYFWVPGTWVEAPEPGFFWTPGYWAWRDDGYFFNEGYWGPEVGFYGGIDYGFGYFGHGFEGGRWENGHFFYNRAVANVNVTVIHNVYETRVNERNVTRVSFNGGNGGLNVRATAQEEAATRQRHVPPVAVQTQHFQAARTNPELRVAANHGKPPIAATARPGEFRQGGVVPAREGGAVHEAPATRPTDNNHNGGGQPANVIHPKELPRAERAAAPNTGNAKRDQKLQQQQEKLQAKQDQERQKLQQKQDKDHQKLEQSKANDARKQQVEQRHQQQTQQLQQRHVQQQQHLQQRTQPAPHPAPAPAKPHSL